MDAFDSLMSKPSASFCFATPLASLSVNSPSSNPLQSCHCRSRTRQPEPCDGRFDRKAAGYSPRDDCKIEPGKTDRVCISLLCRMNTSAT